MSLFFNLLVPMLVAAFASGGVDDDSESNFATFRPGATHGTFEIDCRKVDPKLFEVFTGDPERLEKAIRIVTLEKGRSDSGDQPTLLGTFEIDKTTRLIRFRTRFPTEPGISYALEFRPSAGDRLKRVVFRVPESRTLRQITKVVRVSPTGDLLPENLLRFYIEFSGPMGQGHAYEHVKLLNSTGKALDLPFLELGEELWDPRGQRLTLLFDPGRIKSGLKPRVELGPVLEAGKRYTLVVNKNWQDAAGEPLEKEYHKTFQVGPPDLTPPDPKHWKLERPGAGTRQALVARFPEPLDRAMLGRVLGVVSREGKPIPGIIRVGDEETSWTFTPDEPWAKGGYELRVDRALEDRAGNSVGRPFEVDIFEKVDRPGATGGVVALPFEVVGGE